MLRHSTLSFYKRFYSDSTFSQRVPVVRPANSRVSRVLTNRSNAESRSRDVGRHDPARRFEPFPFKVTEENKLEVVRKTLMPLYSMPYEEQLNSKQSFCRNTLRHVAQELYREGTPVRLDASRLPCHVNPIVRATEIHGYRARDEFSIWKGHDGETPTVGYLVFSPGKHGDSVCVEPNGCTVMREEVIKLSDLLQDFIRHQAKLPVSYSLSNGGWRRFSVSSNCFGELMLVGFLSPRGLKVQQVLDEKESFRNFMVEQAKAADLKLKSLYFQACFKTQCSHKEVPYELLFGEKHINETVDNFKFVISPESSLQASSHGLGQLVTAIRKIAIEGFGLDLHSQKKPLLLDVGCSNGVIGLNMADLVSKVVGVDNSDQAIDDARLNAKLNDITQCEFICSDLEIVIERVLEKYSRFKNDTLVVCSAPVSGFHDIVLETLRRCMDVKKIILVAYKPGHDGFKRNMLGLCRKQQGRIAPPFIPVLATPVDTLPHSEPCHLVVGLERQPD